MELPAAGEYRARMTGNVGDRICALLDRGAAPYEVLEHEAATSAEDAARARGTPLAIGSKALVMKLERAFAVVVVGGDRVMDNRRLRRHLGLRRYRFATREELEALTTLTPGAVPPFGRPVFDLPLYVDAARATLEPMVFSLGSHTRSVRMATTDWLRIAQPDDVFPLVRDAGEPV